MPSNGFPSSLNDFIEIQNDLATSPLSLIGFLTVETIETSGSDEQTDDSDVMVGIKATNEEIPKTFDDPDGKLDVPNPEVVVPNQIWLAQSMFQMQIHMSQHTISDNIQAVFSLNLSLPLFGLLPLPVEILMVEKARVQYEKPSLSSTCEVMLETDNTRMITTMIKLSHQM